MSAAGDGLEQPNIDYSTKCKYGSITKVEKLVLLPTCFISKYHDHDCMLYQQFNNNGGCQHTCERGSSVVECRTRNQESPGSNPPLLRCRRWDIFVLSIDAPVHSAV